MATFKPRVNKTKLYETLSVPFDADLATIKSSYKRLALSWHPDRHVTARADEKEAAAAKFQEVGFAFEVLSDEVLRAAYDADGLPGVEAQSQGHSNGPSRSSSHQDSASAEESTHSEERRRREQAFATYHSVFGQGPPPSNLGVGASSSSGGFGVHNMAAQRGGGSYDTFQRKNLDELFDDLGLKEQNKAGSSQNGSGRHSSSAFGVSRVQNSGHRAPTPDGWYH